MWLDLASINNLKNSWRLLIFWYINYYITQYFTIVPYTIIKEIVNNNDDVE